MSALVILLAVVVGVTLGLLGGGGSILTVPLLVYLAGMDPKQAIVTSLFVVGVTALAGLVGHARAGTVRWRTGLLFGAAGMAGGFVGGLLGGHLPAALLLVAFAVMMLTAAVAMLRARPAPAPARGHPGPPPVRALLIGAVIGLVTALVGAGGGFLVVPALVLLGGLPMPVAVATSLLVIAMQSFAGFAGYLTTVHLDWIPTLALTAAAAVAGGLVGSRLCGRVAASVLRVGFVWFVLVMGAFVLLQQAPTDARPIAFAALVVAGIGCAAVSDRCPLRVLRHA